MGHDRILYISPGGIGNLVMAEPALYALRAAFPRAGITLLTAEPGVHRVLDNEGLLTDHYCYDRSAPQGPLSLWRFVRDMRLRHYELALTAGTVSPLSAGMLMVLAGIPVRAGENISRQGVFYTVRVPYTPGCHERDGALNILEAVGIEPARLVPELHSTGEEKSVARDFLRCGGWHGSQPLLGIHAGCGRGKAALRKRWPEERFAALARTFIAKGVKILLITGPSEKDVSARLSAMIGPGVMNTEGRLSLRESAAAIACCRVFLSNDSGVAHTAAAAGTPLAVLFGPSDPARVAPKGRRKVMVLQSADRSRAIEAIELPEVLSAVETLWRDG